MKILRTKEDQKELNEVLKEIQGYLPFQINEKDYQYDLAKVILFIFKRIDEIEKRF